MAHPQPSQAGSAQADQEIGHALAVRQISHSSAPLPPGTQRPPTYRTSHICTASSLLPVTLGDGLLGGAGIVWHEDLPRTAQLAVPAWMSRTAERSCPVASQGASLPVMRRASRTTGELADSHR
jgi:hypothetical protein